MMRISLDLSQQELEQLDKLANQYMDRPITLHQWLQTADGRLVFSDLLERIKHSHYCVTNSYIRSKLLEAYYKAAGPRPKLATLRRRARSAYVSQQLQAAQETGTG